MKIGTTALEMSRSLLQATQSRPARAEVVRLK
jgi:hypothetical protein